MTTAPSRVGVPTSNVIATARNVPAIISSEWRRYLTQGLFSSASSVSEFVPTLSGMGTPTYVTQHGYWQRSGNSVFVHMYLVWTGGTDGVAIKVGTLPYTPFASFQSLHVVLNTNLGALTWTGTPTAVLNGGVFAEIKTMQSGNTISNILNINAGTKDMCVSGTYRV